MCRGAPCQFIFWILVKEFKSTFIATPLSSRREENISLDLCARAHRDNPTAKLMRQNASIMATIVERSWDVLSTDVSHEI